MFFPLHTGGAPPAGGTHAYFDALVGLDEHFTSASLRVQSVGDDPVNAIDALTGSPPNTSIVYDATMDAAKIQWFYYEKDVQQQLQLPVNQTTGTFLIVWDVQYDDRWVLGQGLNQHYVHKAWQLRFKRNAPTTSSNAIYLETRTGFDAYTAPQIATYNHRIYSAAITPQSRSPYEPGGPGTEPPDWPIYSGKWIRYIQEVRLNQPHTAFTAWTGEGYTLDAGTYHMWSAWALDEDRGPIRMVYQVPIARTKNFTTSPTDEFDELDNVNIEQNTSTEFIQATASVAINGVNGTFIPDNSVVLREGDSRPYRTQADRTITGGTTTVTIQDRGFASAPTSGTVLGGPDGNFVVGTTFTLQTPIAGVDTIVAETAATNGAYTMAETTPVWVRNVVVLKDYVLPSTPENDAVVFQRPEAS